MKCKTEDCTNTILYIGICQVCRNKRYRQKYPIKYQYTILKTNAKRRHKEFTLTYSEFEKFCIASNYDKFHGKTKFDLSIDRINNDIGYTIENIRAITISENCKKHTMSYEELVKNVPF
jgi:hypothetical protein